MRQAEKSGIGAYLQSLRLRSGLSVRALADEADYSGGSSLQTQLNNTAACFQPKVARRFAHALYGRGNPPIELKDLAPLVGATLDGPGAMTQEALQKVLGLSLKLKSNLPAHVAFKDAGRLPVLGSAHASFWMPQSPSLDEPAQWLTIPFMSSRPLPNQYALEIKGPSVNRKAKEGSFAICSFYGEAVQNLPEGKFVHAERERRGEVEWTIKRMKWTAQGVLLIPYSDHPDHQAPLALGDGEDKVTIKGVVIGWYEPE